MSDIFMDDETEEGDGIPVPVVPKARPYMAIQGDVMAACGVCAGSAKANRKGDVVCSKDVPVDCILLRTLAYLRKTDKSSEANRTLLSTIADTTWIGQHAGATLPLPIAEVSASIAE